MKSLDRKLAAIVKTVSKLSPDGLNRESISREFHGIRDQVSSSELPPILDRLVSILSAPKTELNASTTIDLLKATLAIGYSETAAAVFPILTGSLPGVQLWEILPVIPNSACFELWIKAGKFPIREIEIEILNQPMRAYETAGADWLCFHAQSESLMKIHELILSRHPRPRHLPAWDEVLSAIIKKDKKGDTLAALLRSAGNCEDRMKSLTETIRSHRAMFKSVADLLPAVLARKEPVASAVQFASSLFDPAIASDEADREFTTVILARLGTGILLSERRTPDADAVLALIQKITRQLRNLTQGKASQSRTWVLENLLSEEKEPDGKMCVNLQGARYMALAFEKVDQGFPMKEILSVTARHLGLSLIGKRDEVVSYDPLKHDDIAGGLVPGDSVVITESGLAYNSEAVLRAKVGKFSGGKNV